MIRKELLPARQVMPPIAACLFFVAVSVLLLCQTGRGQVASPSWATSKQVSLSEITSKSKSASVRLQEIKTSLSFDRTTADIEHELPLLAREIEILLRDGERIFRSYPSLNVLNSMTTSLENLGQDLARLSSNLDERSKQLSRQAGRIDEIRSELLQTQALAQSSGASSQLLLRLQHFIGTAGQMIDDIHSEAARIVNQQNRLAEQQGLVDDARDAVEQARHRKFHNLFSRDDPPIWAINPNSELRQNVVRELGVFLAPEPVILRGYAERRLPALLSVFVLFGLTLTGLCLARLLARKCSESSALHGTAIFEAPISSAMVLSILLSGMIITQAPRSLRDLFGLVALILTTLVLRRVVEPVLFPIPYALITFYFVDLVRDLFTPFPILSRWLLLVELLAALLFLWWLIRSRPNPDLRKVGNNLLLVVIKSYAWIALIFVGLAFVMAVVGYVNLASLVGNAVMSSAYFAIVLYAGIKIVDSLIQALMQVPPLSFLGIVRRHRSAVHRRVCLVFQLIAVLTWLSATLNSAGLSVPVSEMVGTILNFTLTLGSIRISFGQVLAFVLTVWASFQFSSFIRFLLEEDIYDRLHIARGLPYAISTLVHYVVLLAGFFIGVALIGFDMTKVTILAGAFTVGVGFGLQNVINNFVSGIILLFERPIKVGDLIQVGDASGVVERIGVRACVIRTNEGSEVIVPNAKLISEQLTNWTFTDRQRAIVISISTVHDADPGHVMELVKKVAGENPLIIKDPAPQAFLVTFGPGPLSFELRVWTSNGENWMQTRSDISVAIKAALAHEGLAIS